MLEDDYSHYKVVFFLKQKSGVKQLLEGFIKRVQTETGKVIKRLRTDKGLEFLNREVQSILQKYGIKHETSVAYTPEQNGAIERENRTVVEAARSMLYAKSMDLGLWAEAVHTTVFVLNRTGTSSVHDKTPYELWFGTPASNLDLKIFGTEVFTHIPKQKRTK